MFVSLNHQSNDDFSNQIEQARVMFQKELDQIDDLEDITLKLVCMFAMIDRMAQERASYSKHSKDVFCNFILDIQREYDYLECVEPITLYYRLKLFHDEGKGISKTLVEENFEEKLDIIYGSLVKQVARSEKTVEFIKCLEEEYGFDIVSKGKKEHHLIDLLYRMRSKAMHEMSGLGENITWEGEFTEPFYRDIGDIELVIPVCFIRNLLEDCIKGYLDECSRNRRLPFGNNSSDRKSRLSWYDYPLGKR